MQTSGTDIYDLKCWLNRKENQLRGWKNRHACPVCKGGVRIGVLGLTMHLNDEHKWSFLMIADYLEKSKINVSL